MSIIDEVQKAIDDAREEGCPLCPNPKPPTTFVLRVIAVHPECIAEPEEDDEDEVTN